MTQSDTHACTARTPLNMPHASRNNMKLKTCNPRLALLFYSLHHIKHKTIESSLSQARVTSYCAIFPVSPSLPSPASYDRSSLTAHFCRHLFRLARRFRMCPLLTRGLSTISNGLHAHAPRTSPSFVPCAVERGNECAFAS